MFVAAVCTPPVLVLAQEAQYLKETQKVVYEAPQEEEEEPEVQVVVRINWTTDRVKEEIRKVFPDAPIMLEVARCESGFKPNAYNPTNGSGDKGIMQISTKYHGHRTNALGLDMYDVQDNLKYARMLYDESGLQPWKWSKPCWSK
jgi:hypothetical protein